MQIIAIQVVGVDNLYNAGNCPNLHWKDLFKDCLKHQGKIGFTL